MELIGYALDFVSFLMQNIKEKNNVNSIILFGSAAREEATKESDVDIFADLKESNKKIEKEIKEILNRFYESARFKNYWKPIGLENKINIITGKLNEWKLKDSMLGNSIILYQKYSPKLEDGKSKVILSWENPKNNSKIVMLNKKISGYRHYKRVYPGLLEKYKGEKIGFNVILIHAEDLNLFLKEFYKFKIPVKIRQVFEYSL